MIDGPADKPADAIPKLFRNADDRKSDSLVYDPTDHTISLEGSAQKRELEDYCGDGVKPFGTDYQDQIVPGVLGPEYTASAVTNPITPPITPVAENNAEEVLVETIETTAVLPGHPPPSPPKTPPTPPALLLTRLPSLRLSARHPPHFLDHLLYHPCPQVWHHQRLSLPIEVYRRHCPVRYTLRRLCQVHLFSQRTRHLSDLCFQGMPHRLSVLMRFRHLLPRASRLLRRATFLLYRLNRLVPGLV